MSWTERALGTRHLRPVLPRGTRKVCGRCRAPGCVLRSGARIRPLRDVFTGKAQALDVTGLFIAIGHDPRTELFKGQLELDDDGYVKVASPSTRTNIPGDVVDHT
ncbi:hypothetical protein FB157_13921 [Streptomyces sp. BK340]|nr:hypothetical protein FB157_13921 [Streptomyces sp. BK340]